MAAPPVTRYIRDNPRNLRILMDVAGDRQEILLSVNEYRAVPTPKERPVSVMGSVKPLGINAIEVAHGPRQIALRRLQK